MRVIEDFSLVVITCTSRQVRLRIKIEERRRLRTYRYVSDEWEARGRVVNS